MKTYTFEDSSYEWVKADDAEELVDALEDMLSGWRYIREVHGDLCGVGWERAENKATIALAKIKGRV